MGGVVTIGETLVSLTSPKIGPLRHSRSLGVGVAGAESNVAIGLCRLGKAAKWIGRVSNDEFGRLVLSQLQGEGVDVAHAVVDPKAPTGLMVVERRTSELRRVTYYRTGSAGSSLSPGDIPLDTISSAGLVHLTGITPALSASAREATELTIATANSAGVSVSFTVNYRHALWSPEAARKVLIPMMQRADLLFASEEEASLITGEPTPDTAVQALARLGRGTAVVTLGAAGAVAAAEGRELRGASVPVTVIDTVGAGDAFTSGWLAAHLEGAPVDDCMDSGLRSAAFAVSSTGDWEGLPDSAELELLGRYPGDVVR